MFLGLGLQKSIASGTTTYSERSLMERAYPPLCSAHLSTRCALATLHSTQMHTVMHDLSKQAEKAAVQAVGIHMQPTCVPCPLVKNLSNQGLASTVWHLMWEKCRALCLHDLFYSTLTLQDLTWAPQGSLATILSKECLG